jgi:hypothetical protein
MRSAYPVAVFHHKGILVKRYLQNGGNIFADFGSKMGLFVAAFGGCDDAKMPTVKVFAVDGRYYFYALRANFSIICGSFLMSAIGVPCSLR